jgi:hypothetical protein
LEPEEKKITAAQGVAWREILIGRLKRNAEIFEEFGRMQLSGFSR